MYILILKIFIYYITSIFCTKFKKFFVDRKNIYTSDKLPFKITVYREKTLLPHLLTSDTAIFYKIAEK